MKTPLLLLALLGAAPAAPPAIPNGTRDAETPSELWSRLAGAHASAQGLDLKAAGRVELTDGGNTVEMEVLAEARIARPLHGRIELTQKGSVGDVTLELIGTGERLILVDHASRATFPVGEEWVPLLHPEPALLAVWRGETVEPASVTAASDDQGAPEGQEGRIGLVLELEDRRETVWLADGRPVASDVDANDGSTNARLRFERWSAPKEVEVDAYRAAPPADYTNRDPMAEFEKDLMAVGAPIPQATVRDLSGQEVPLASLRGKTFLLNFWFYH